jgi:hypothetical protein
MLIRLAILFSALLIASSTVLYLVTRDPRYPRFAWQVVRFMGYALLVFGVLYLLERFGLAAWMILV